MDILYIVMPAYNEEKNIKDAIEGWYPLLEGKSNESCLVVADSGSTDKTHMILCEMKRRYSKLRILTGTEKEHGPKVIALYDYAIREGADYIFQTDSDGQTNPAEFETFWNLRDGYDVILGYRTRRGDGKFRAFIEKVVCFLLKMYFGVKLPDANAPFRLMKRDVLKRYIARLPFDYNLPNIMLTVYFSYYGENLTFREISFKPRQGGVNTINIKKIVKIGWKALDDFKEFKKEM